jgi:hypothetical protein
MTDIDPYVFSEAVREFWQTRERQALSQRHRGKTNHGARSAVTGGRQMDGFARKIKDLLVSSGVQETDIYVGPKAELPGFFRAQKKWDLVVVSRGQLLAAVELKAQAGPSFGNNFNNRVEEALGAALDFWTAYHARVFRTSKRPWLGYLFLLEDCPESRSPVTLREPHFAVFPEFQNTSYAKRYEIFCRKLILERLYSAVCLLVAEKDRARARQNYSEPADDLSAKRFLLSLLGHVAGF